MNYLNYYEHLEEYRTPFRTKKSHILLFDLPMFSIFLDVNLPEPNSTMIFFRKMETIAARLQGLKTNIEKAFDSARYEIHKMGFPSMHVNVLIKNLSKDVNIHTGGGVGGYAHGNERYIDIDFMVFFDGITSEGYFKGLVNTIVHEWAHLYMFNRPKEFKTAIKGLYDYITKQSSEMSTLMPAIQQSNPRFTDEQERFILKKWKDSFGVLFEYYLYDYPECYYISSNFNKPFDLEFAKYLPHLMEIKGILKKSKDEFPVGEYVYLIKGSHGSWIIGKTSEPRSTRKETTIPLEDLTDYVTSVDPNSTILNDINLKLKELYISQNKQELMESLVKDLVKNAILHVNLIADNVFNDHTIIDDDVKKQISEWMVKYVVPVYINILRNPVKLKEIKNDKTGNRAYEALWILNPKKPKNVSSIDLFKKLYKKSIEKIIKSRSEKGNTFGGTEFQIHREILKNLSKWINSYGLSNTDELWATAIEMFFNLPMSYRKAIVKIVMGIKL
jgi:hypothetical protein